MKKPTSLTPDQIAASRDRLLAEGFHPDSKAVRDHEQLLAMMQDHPRHTEAACQSMEDLKAECVRLRIALEDLINRTKNFGHTGFPSMAHFNAFSDAWLEAKETLAVTRSEGRPA